MAFANETEAARNLALYHGKLWEFSLVDELLKSKLGSLKHEYADFNKTLLSIPKRQCSRSEFIGWIGDQLDSLQKAIYKLGNCAKVDLPEPWESLGFQATRCAFWKPLIRSLDLAALFLLSN